MPIPSVAADPHTRAPAGRAALLAASIYIAMAAIALAGRAVAPETVLATILLGVLLVALSSIDWSTLRLPDPLTALLAAAGLAVSAALTPEDLIPRIEGALVGFCSLALLGAAHFKLSGRRGLGLGDAKLLGAAGAWVGISGLATIVLWSSAGALAAVLAALALGYRIDRDTRLAFGPFLAFATWLVWLFGPIG